MYAVMDPNMVYTFNFYDENIDLTTYKNRLPLGLPDLDMTTILNGQPLSLGARTEDGVYLFSFCGWNRRTLMQLQE